jgi:UDPglucose 6-dehydrogenase
VLGVASDGAEARLREVYASLVEAGVPVVRTDPPTAELAKCSANVMLASRISVVNVLAEVCEAAGADIEHLTEVLGLDPRIGPHYLSPGLGFGGGCLPKDLRAFATRAAELGVESATGLLGAVDDANTHQRERTVRLATELLGGQAHGARVAVLGAAFKAGSDDVRDSPALAVASAIAARGAHVAVHDPEAGHHLTHRPDLHPAESVESACAAADLTMVLTEWPSFGRIDPVALGGVVGRRVVLDARLVIEPDRWRDAGWQVHALGRPRPPGAGADPGAGPVSQPQDASALDDVRGPGRRAG